ncbi:MAG: 16S rRNA (adenine(1518)-N(6)/adenine(1519)-N(6))-dimethyltransferase RsmA [bacterium]|nr:16S rRNA (adenine(1518)-N(6)/adenine(1519)-N(6))-dimethyltransferase RsmA [bacterium]
MRQRLGQHFLKDVRVLKKIALALRVKDGDAVIEIGPGHGELTDFLLAEAAKHKKIKIIVIERDEALAAQLQTRHSALKNFQVITGDALKEIPKLFLSNRRGGVRKIVGNIPYYITGSLLRVISELKHKPETSALLVQKEVALRIVARPPRMNLLSAAVQAWAEPKIIEDVSRFDFSPPPEVDASLLILRTIKNFDIPAFYYPFIRALFKQPRKTILNNLREGTTKTKDEIVETLLRKVIELNDRPQDLTLVEIIDLARAF